MAVFPSTPDASYSYTIEPEWKTVIAGFDGGNEERDEKWDFPRYNVKLVYEDLDAAGFRQLWDHYMAHRGASRAFNFYALLSDTYNEPLYVGTGDAAQTIFDLPGRSTSGQSLSIGGVVQSGGYTVLSGGGEDSSDRVEFTSPPEAGGIITCSFTGFLRIRCRYANDRLTKELFAYQLYRTGIELKGLRG